MRFPRSKDAPDDGLESRGSAVHEVSGTAGLRSRIPRMLAAAGLLAAIFGGVWARVHGLGLSPLANDEYYFVLSIRKIIQHGYPVFETGGLYTRAILIQYLTVPSMLLAGSDELGVRIPSVVFGLATVWVAWLYGRRTLGRPYALTLVVFLLLSSWEVEFSRFGRMYAGFQLVVLGMLVALHDTMGGARGVRRYLTPLLGLLALLSHQLGVLFVPLVFLPAFVPGARERLGGRGGVVRYLAACAPVVLVAWISRSVNFRSEGIADRLPAGYVGTASSQLHVPYFPFQHLPMQPEEHFFIVLGVLLLVAGVAGFLWHRGRIRAPLALAVVMCVASAAHMLVVSFGIGVAIVLRYGPRKLWKRERAAALLTIGAFVVALGWLAFVGWLTFAVGDRAWIQAGGYHLFRQAARAAFIWPDPRETVWLPWSRELPVTGALVLGALVVQIVTKARRTLVELVQNPAFVVVYVIVVFGCFSPSLAITRYTFVVYPVALALLLLSVEEVASWAAGRLPTIQRGARLGVPAALLLFLVGGDFHPRHLLRVATPEAIYRTGPFQRFEPTWYPRDDFSSPARFVARVADGDPVIVEEAPPVSYYLDRQHAIYLDRRGHRFPNVSREGGTRDFWTGLRLLSTIEDVRDYTRCASRVWIVESKSEPAWIAPKETWGGRLRGTERAYVSPDSVLEVVRVDLAGASSCPDSTAARPKETHEADER